MTASATQDKSQAPKSLDEYSNFVSRLLASKPHTEVVPPAVMAVVLSKALETKALLDQVKKGLFYGKDTPALAELRSQALAGYSPEYSARSLPMLHAILGLRTEADELLEMLVTALDGYVVKKADQVDEAGDLLFYLQALLNQTGSSLAEAINANAAKLLVRFPDGFNEAAATSPDKAAEAAAQWVALS